MKCFGQLPDLPPGVEAYRFDTDDGPVIVGWTAEGNSTLMAAAEEKRVLLDREGERLDSMTPVQSEAAMVLGSTPRFLIVDVEE